MSVFDDDVYRAVRKQLAAIVGIPTILWPNKKMAIEPPFVVYSNGPQPAKFRTGLGGSQYIRYAPMISVMSPADEYTSGNSAVSRLVEAAFTAGTDILHATTSLKIAECHTDPSPTPGEHQGDFWRVDMYLDVRRNRGE